MHTTNKNNYITLKEHMSKQETKQKDDNAIYLVATKAQAKPITKTKQLHCQAVSMQQGARKQVASSAKTQPTCSETPSVLLCDRASACLPRQVSFIEQPEVQEFWEVEGRTVNTVGPWQQKW